jgi:hypothetical protein
VANDNSAPKEWKTMEAFKDDASHNLKEPVRDFVGRQLEFTFDEACGEARPPEKVPPVEIVLSINDSDSVYTCGENMYKASVTTFKSQEDLYYISVEILDPENEDINIILNTSTNRAVAVPATARPEPVEGECRVVQRFLIGGLSGQEWTGFKPGRTRELIGTRLYINYSPNMYYEHIYLNSERICWHNLRGEQFGHSACEPCDYFKIDENVYLMSWRELFIPCGAAYLLNFNNKIAMGKFIGWDQDEKISHSFSGGSIHILSQISYPKECEPK